jgi:hypothetical protein
MPAHSHNRRTPFTLSVLACLTFCSSSVIANARAVTCKASWHSLPAASELQGFQLGMTMEQLKVVAPQIVFGRIDSLGSSKTSISPAFDPNADKSKFQDVRTISFELLDGRVVSLWIGYDTSFKWSTVPEFVTGISKSLSLPNAWTEKARARQMMCSDFEVTVSMIAQSPSLRIVDTVAAQTLAERRTAAVEEAEASESEDSEPEEIVADRKTKTYYQGNCRPRDPISDADRILFKSAEDAEKAGYSLSKSCS